MPACLGTTLALSVAERLDPGAMEAPEMAHVAMVEEKILDDDVCRHVVPDDLAGLVAPAIVGIGLIDGHHRGDAKAVVRRLFLRRLFSVVVMMMMMMMTVVPMIFLRVAEKRPFNDVEPPEVDAGGADQPHRHGHCLRDIAQLAEQPASLFKIATHQIDRSPAG